MGDISTASHYMYAGGQYLGELTEHGQIRVKQQHFKGLDVIKSDSSRVHQVQEGETLRSIAQLQYGNSNFWFIIADANSLTSTPDEGLTVGQSLTIPQQNNNQNSFDTLLPMNLAELIGDTTPSLGYLPPPSEAGCNAVASIIMIAVAVAVTGGVAGASLIANGAANAAFAAAVGSAASQVAGMALGAVDNFSWKQVAISAITAGATKGLGDKLKLDQIGANVAHDIARGAISYGAGHAANKLLGQQTSFSWSNVAASSLGYAAGAQVGTALAEEIGVDFSTDFGSQLTSELTSGVADLHIGRALGENTKVDYGQIGLDAFGNAIGNTIAGRMERARQVELQQQRLAQINEQHSRSSQRLQDNAAQDLNDSIAGTEQRIAGEANATLDERYSTNINPNNRDDGYTPLFQSEAGANFLNRSTTLTQALQDDVRVKADALNQHQQRNLQNQQWVNRNTNELGRPQQGFDLASLIADTTSWQGDLEASIAADPRVSWSEAGYTSYDLLSDAGDIARNSVSFAASPKLNIAKNVLVANGVDGVTLAAGVTGGVSSGAGGDSAIGGYLTLDFNKSDFNYGLYGSAEGNANLTIPVPERHGGFEFSIFPTSDSLSALNGQYDIEGGVVNTGIFKAFPDADLGFVTTDNGKLRGFQFSLTKGTSVDDLVKLPIVEPYYSAGHGVIFWDSKGRGTWGN